MAIIAGYDNGRLYTKTVGLDQKIITVNAVCRGYELRTIEQKISVPEQQMDFDFYKDDKKLGRFFVGGMAVKNHSGDLIFSTSGMKKFSAEVQNFELAKFFGNMALLAFKQGMAGGVVECFIGTGLPIEEFFSSSDTGLDEFVKEVLSSRFKVEFLSEIYKGYSIEFKVKAMEKTAEGTASLTGTRVMFQNGQITVNDSLERYLQVGPILVVNLGSSTSDLAVLLEDGTYDPRGFIGIEIGSEWALSYVGRRLKEEYGYTPEKIDLEALVLSGKNLLYKGTTIELVTMVNEAYGLLINQVRTKLYEALRMNNININALGAVFYTGGTSEFAVKTLGSDAVKRLIKDVPGILSDDPIFDDAKGYLALAYTEYVQSKQQVTGIAVDPNKDLVEVS